MKIKIKHDDGTSSTEGKYLIGATDKEVMFFGNISADEIINSLVSLINHLSNYLSSKDEVAYMLYDIVSIAYLVYNGITEDDVIKRTDDFEIDVNEYYIQELLSKFNSIQNKEEL